MAHVAELNENNEVVRIIVVSNDITDPEAFAEEWANGGRWVQTSYNASIRGVYAGVGFTYNQEEDIFVTPQPYPSWVRSGSLWNPPIPCPEDGKNYSWNEETGSWNELS